MKKIIIITLLAFMIIPSCRIKNDCELNNTGTIRVKNNTDKAIEVFVNEQKVVSIEAGKYSEIEEKVGDNVVKCLSFPEEWIYDIVVTQCKTIEVSVPN